MRNFVQHIRDEEENGREAAGTSPQKYDVDFLNEKLPRRENISPAVMLGSPSMECASREKDGKRGTVSKFADCGRTRLKTYVLHFLVPTFSKHG